MSKIFESPDGGETVYARQPGEHHRVLVKESERSQTKKQLIQENQLWQTIRNTARENPALQAELDRVKMLYYLITKNDNR